jgi:hypothetical protein
MVVLTPVGSKLIWAPPDRPHNLSSKQLCFQLIKSLLKNSESEEDIHVLGDNLKRMFAIFTSADRERRLIRAEDSRAYAAGDYAVVYRGAIHILGEDGSGFNMKFVRGIWITN